MSVIKASFTNNKTDPITGVKKLNPATYNTINQE